MQVSKKDIKNTIIMVLANIFAVLVSLLNGFIIPKLVSVETYSQFKTYSLYIGYLGIFHLGFVNGIYMKYGNLSFKELPREKFRSFTRYLFIQQLCMSTLIVIPVLVFIKEQPWRHPLFFVGLSLLPINISGYYSWVNQFTQRFANEGKIIVISNIFNILLVISVWIFGIDNYLYLIIFQLSIKIIILIIWIVWNVEITFGKRASMWSTRRDIMEAVHNGFFVTISEYMGIIILGIDSIIINNFFDNIEYARYAFAVSVVALLFTLITAISKVIFPYLMRIPKDKYDVLYIQMSKLIIVFSQVILCIMFFSWIAISKFIPKYNMSISIIIILSPIITFRSLLEMICNNFYKVLGLSKEYLKNNVVALILGICTDFCAYRFYGTTEAIAIASLLSFALWYLLTDLYFTRKLKVEIKYTFYKYGMIVAITLIYIFSVRRGPYIGLFLFGIFTIFMIGITTRVLWCGKIKKRWAEYIK